MQMTRWHLPLIAAVVMLSSVLAAQTKQDASYTATTNAVYSFIDLVSSGGSSSVLSNTDDGVALLTLPFPFTFYGNTYTLVCASSNGILSFVTTPAACSPSPDFANADLSTSSLPNDLPALVPFWTDLLFTGTGGVYYQTQGTAPNRSFVIEWSNAYQPPDTDNPATFEVVLYETSGNILFQYQTVDFGAANPISQGGQAVIGIRDQAGQSNGREIAWSSNAPVIPNSTAIAFARRATTYFVGDVYPYTSDLAGSFGLNNGVINLLDLLATLRAITNIPGSVPALCSDRFDAMDSWPVDTTNSRGGDGILNILDLLETLRRIANTDTSRPTRTSRGGVCPSGVSPAGVSGESRKSAPSPAEGSLEFGTPVANGKGGWRIPIQLHAKVDMDLAGLAFSAGYDSASSSTVLNFVAAGQAPDVIDRDFPGKIAMAWLKAWQAKAGDVVDLGYVETSLPPDSLRLYGVSANAAGSGRTVPIALPQPYRRTR